MRVSLCSLCVLLLLSSEAVRVTKVRLAVSDHIKVSNADKLIIKVPNVS